MKIPPESVQPILTALAVLELLADGNVTDANTVTTGMTGPEFTSGVLTAAQLLLNSFSLSAGVCEREIVGSLRVALLRAEATA